MNTKPYNSVTLSQAADLVATVGDKVTCLFSGEMGIGKSAMLGMLKQRFPEHRPVYLDAPLLDVGDIMMPKVGTESVTFLPNEYLGFHLTQPVLLMIDELGKCNKAVMNTLLRIIHERKLGKYTLPEGSIVFATTNLSIEGLGDNIPAHARSRMCQAKIRKYTGVEWVEEYGFKAGIHPVVLGAAIEFPQMFASFEDVEDPNSNHYINHPKAPRTAFVTHRGMEKASDILKATEALPDDVRVHALMGVVGEAAAMDILTLVKFNDTLPTWEQVINNPEEAKLPKGAAASCMMIGKAIQRVERDTFDDWMTYVQRMGKEVQALWARSVMRSPKVSIATTHRGFAEWAAANSFLFT